jgi:hypothetical protein
VIDGIAEAQVEALAELGASDLFTAIAWRIKEKLRWIRLAQSVQAAGQSGEGIGDRPLRCLFDMASVDSP